jgi:hypothetical protein
MRLGAGFAVLPVRQLGRPVPGNTQLGILIYCRPRPPRKEPARAKNRAGNRSYFTT